MTRREAKAELRRRINDRLAEADAMIPSQLDRWDARSRNLSGEVTVEIDVDIRPLDV